MESLYNLVFECWTRNKNISLEYFVSGQDLREHMTLEFLRKAVDEVFPPYHVDDVVNGINRGGHKTFAILVLIRQPKQIIKFIENVQYLSYGIDRLLPLAEEQLLDILSERPLAVEFDQKQWSFTAPVFFDSLFPTAFHPKVVLPFLEEEELGHGGFGDVYGVQIEPSFQRFNDTVLCQHGVGLDNQKTATIILITDRWYAKNFYLATQNRVYSTPSSVTFQYSSYCITRTSLN